MAEMAAASMSALAGLATAGQRFGRRDGAAGVTVMERVGLRILSIQARRGQMADLSAKFQAATGIALPTEPKRADGEYVSVVWTAPEQWLVFTGSAAGASKLATDLAGLASITDQSDSRALIEISGSKVHEMLAKGVMIDLHPKVFRPGDTAVTTVAHIGAQVTKLNAQPVFEIMVPRSFVESFWDFLVESSSEFGLSVAARA